MRENLKKNYRMRALIMSKNKMSGLFFFFFCLEFVLMGFEFSAEEICFSLVLHQAMLLQE